jgi:hypothetical protein
MWQMVVTRDRLASSSTPLLLFYYGICDQLMHICIPSREIHRLGPNWFISIEWYPYEL